MARFFKFQNSRARRCVVLLALSAVSCSLWAQITTPTLGYVPDGSSVRPVYGIPADASVAAPINTGQALNQITVSPHQDFVLATDPASGSVLMVYPGVSVTPLTTVAPGPDSITMSPSGSAAILWWNSLGNFQIVGGLPNAPAVIRTVNTSFLGGAPTALTVSDDGSWMAGVWGTGVYAFGPTGQVNPLPVTGVTAVAFFHQRDDLVVASASQIYTVTDVGGAAAVSAIYNAASNVTLAPLALAVSFDNQHVAYFDETSALVEIDLSTDSSSATVCGCAPQGLFGMNGSIFRLTDLSSGVLKLFDASSGSVYVLPLAAPLVSAAAQTANIAGMSNAAALPAAPAVTITPTTTSVSQQPAVTLTIANAYPVDINGTLSVSFTSAVGGGDSTIQFSSVTSSLPLGSSLSFTIPAGGTQAAFAGAAYGVVLLTGTVAGTITLTATLSAQGTPLSPQPAPVGLTINPTPPVITGITFNQPSLSMPSFSITITGFSDTRDMISAAFHFTPTTVVTLAQTDITVPLTSAFASYYATGSPTYGSEFVLTVPFSVSGGRLAVLGATATLTNSKGTSTTSNGVGP